MQLTQYKIGELYVPHHDYFNVNGYNNTVVNDRVATVIVYLNDGFFGGHTEFTQLNISVKPKRGMALYFKYNYTAEINAQTIHSGNYVNFGTKYITQAFIRGNTWYVDELHKSFG